MNELINFFISQGYSPEEALVKYAPSVAIPAVIFNTQNYENN